MTAAFLSPTSSPHGPPPPSDPELVARIRAGDHACFELLMRRYNARLYRAARSIVPDDDEAEDVVQQAYLSAFRALHQFNGDAKLSTWLTRIAVHEALRRVRRRHRVHEVADAPSEDGGLTPRASEAHDPERRASARQLGRALESAIDALPSSYRTVLMLRDVEHMTTPDTAAALGVSEDNVRVRLHRARTRLRQSLARQTDGDTSEPFPFGGERCDRIVTRVFAYLDAMES